VIKSFKAFFQILSAVWLIFMLLIIQGCASGYAPVTDQSIQLEQQIEIVRGDRGNKREKAGDSPAEYVVVRGDTLYSIAWRYGLDYRDIAKRNRIGSADHIYVGQRLKLIQTPVQSVVAELPEMKNELTNYYEEAPRKAKPITNPAPTAKTPVKTSPTTIPKATVKPNQIKPAKVVVSPSVPEKVKKPDISATPKSQALVWKWPANGSVITRFKPRDEMNKGINIAGRKGEPVYAAAAGKVVYAGSGLLGYGNLIIINHNQEYLSAYAHNSRILVTENDNVNVGEKIAEIGSSGATRTMLHFEIRKDGKPVNPLQYLPRR